MEDRFIIYGIIELDTRRIVYIDFYIGNEDYLNIDDKEFLIESLETMQEEDNCYWRDLKNMWDRSRIETKIVILEVLKDDKEVYEITNAYRKLFKPKYCSNYNKGYNFRLEKE